MALRPDLSVGLPFSKGVCEVNHPLQTARPGPFSYPKTRIAFRFLPLRRRPYWGFWQTLLSVLKNEIATARHERQVVGVRLGFERLF